MRPKSVVSLQQAVAPKRQSSFVSRVAVKTVLHTKNVPGPTARTPWSSFVPHVPVSTAVWKRWKKGWSAWLVIDTGCGVKADLRTYPRTVVLEMALGPKREKKNSTARTQLAEADACNSAVRHACPSTRSHFESPPHPSHVLLKNIEKEPSPFPQVQEDVVQDEETPRTTTKAKSRGQGKTWNQQFEKGAVWCVFCVSSSRSGVFCFTTRSARCLNE